MVIATRARPRIAIPARFSESASALRFRAEVTARKLVEAIYDAGGEPLSVHPHAPESSAEFEEIDERFALVDGLLLPGGGDILPSCYGGVLSELTLDAASRLRQSVRVPQLTISCYHHQAVDRLGHGLQATAWSDDGVIEAVELSGPGDQWFLGVQWHPEDTADIDEAQLDLFRAFVHACAGFGARRR